MSKKKIVLVLVLLVVVAAAAVVAHKKMGKKLVTFSEPLVAAAPGDGTVALEEPEPAPEPAYVVPSHTLGINTRDGSIRNVDIRGAPALTITEDVPIWGISSNLSQNNAPHKFFQ